MIKLHLLDFHLAHYNSHDHLRIFFYLLAIDVQTIFNFSFPKWNFFDDEFHGWNIETPSIVRAREIFLEACNTDAITMVDVSFGELKISKMIWVRKFMFENKINKFFSRGETREKSQN